ncbi:VirB3 family type IV secretion system protein [Emcibacter nanhaiensis]|uniref:Conjugal transfer protein n=1 Tax=Emcibacter nanhaiensis TaxID=1505037 RepID=A0A501PFR2_9PROT|nr:VirB3 family type IV secretion system protein [Emcibacter nanhaiensis]TPD59309.1 conjugal transfer protein [Emcibacter nanhaiensis]
MTDNRPIGLEVPLHRSLTEPLLLAGARRSVTIVIGTLAAAMGLGLQLWLAGLLLWFTGQSLAVWLTRRDPDFLETGLRHLRHKDYYS